MPFDVKAIRNILMQLHIIGFMKQRYRKDFYMQLSIIIPRSTNFVVGYGGKKSNHHSISELEKTSVHLPHLISKETTIKKHKETWKRLTANSSNN